MLTKVNLNQKMALIDEHWSPRIAGELNNFYVKLARLKGEFIWHHHQDEDEMFLVLKGKLIIKLRDGDVELKEGEFLVRILAESKGFCIEVYDRVTFGDRCNGIVFSEQHAIIPETRWKFLFVIG